MSTDIDTVTKWLMEASRRIPQDCMRLPVAGAETPAYRERVYCYELYHHWRDQWSPQSRFTLSGEVDKTNHPLIGGKSKPDFLVHVPGSMDNLLVMEVKPANAKVSKMVKDLKTLDKFRSRLGEGRNYAAAYFWVYGLKSEHWPALREKLKHAVVTLDIDPARISFLVHEKSGNRVHIVEW